MYVNFTGVLELFSRNRTKSQGRCVATGPDGVHHSKITLLRDTAKAIGSNWVEELMSVRENILIKLMLILAFLCNCD